VVVGVGDGCGGCSVGRGSTRDECSSDGVNESDGLSCSVGVMIVVVGA